jgi:hypothetical protein
VAKFKVYTLVEVFSFASRCGSRKPSPLRRLEKRKFDDDFVGTIDQTPTQIAIFTVEQMVPVWTAPKQNTINKNFIARVFTTIIYYASRKYQLVIFLVSLS